MLTTLEPFLIRLFHLIDEAGVDVSKFEMDHVCYRVATMERYHELCHAWSRYTKNHEFHESLVNGRPIAVFVLASPPTICGRVIPVVELPAPKDGVVYEDGWEHAEFVLDEPFQHFMSRYEELPFDRKSLGKELNPELGLKLGLGLQVKFHHQSLAEIIKIEAERGLNLMHPV